MTDILISDIEIGQRHRKDYGDLSDLVDSIREHGVLSPITLLPGNRLLCGGRRVEACKTLGLESVPYHLTTRQDDALSQIKAERDENTCRKPMTMSELVAVGREIEALEAPRGNEARAEGARAGAAARWGDAFGSAEQKASAEPVRTRAKVADALGISQATYTRAKTAITAAESDPDPEVREVAKQAVEDMDAGTVSVKAASEKVRAARNPEKKKEINDNRPPAPPRYGGNRKKHLAIIESVTVALSGMTIVVDEIITSGLDKSVTAEEAERLANDLSLSLRSLNRIKQLLTQQSLNKGV